MWYVHVWEGGMGVGRECVLHPYRDPSDSRGGTYGSRPLPYAMFPRSSQGAGPV